MAMGTKGINGIMTVAERKLCNSEKFDAADTNQTLAVLSQRFAVDPRLGHHDYRYYIEKGISNHLRVCYSVTQDRMWSGYPSEPLLSCVSAHLLYQTPSNLTTALHALKEMCDDELIDRGKEGELASRLMLLLAKDMYVRKFLSDKEGSYVRNPHDDEHWEAELLDCQKVSIIHFLEYIFGESFWSMIGDAKTAFEHAYINFSHWVTMEDLINPKNSDTDL